MENFWILFLVLFFTTNSLDKAESVKLELKTFDEIFGEGWWDKGEAEDLKTPTPTNFGQNVHHQIDRQNTQIGQIEPNSTDQLGQIEPNSTDQLGQIEPNSTDQNPPFTESDHVDNAKNGEENTAEEEQKRKIIAKFHAMKDEFKQKGKFPYKERIQIEDKIAKHLKRKAELKRAGIKNSQNELDKTVAKELGLSVATIYKWKSELGQSKPQHNHNEQKELMKCYYQIKDKNPKIRDEDIAKILKIGRVTLCRWKKLFKRQQFHPNSVDGHSVEVNATANVQEIGKSNLAESI
uniref:Transposase n=1 Tax=Globodera rostochiensis TaxID=31243 RepID=A0A914HRY7_GLORO